MRKSSRKFSPKRRLAAESLETRNLMATVPIQVTVENLNPEGGLAATPFWLGFHNGDFVTGSTGRSAAEFAGLESLAEEGDPAGLSSRFALTSVGVNAVLAAPGGFPGAPVFEPGETVSEIIDVPLTQQNRYFSFASMVIPSNDAFVANLNPRQYRAFDAIGNFRGPFSIDIYGRDVWDAGSEVNDPNGGAAFSTEGGESVDENGVIHRHQGLDDFINTGLPTGGSLDSAFIDQTPLYRITLSLASRPSGPVDRHAPEVELLASNATDSNSNSHELQIIYSDPSGVDASSIDTNDLFIIGRNGRRLRVTGARTDAAPGVDPRTLTATYTVTPLDGSFSANDNATYTVFLQHRTISDTVGNRTFFSRLGDFSVDVGVNLQVTVENLSPLGGLAGTPFWLAFHDGGFEIGRTGQQATQFGGLEEIAEEGNPTALSARFASESAGVDAVLTAPDGFAGAPVFEPEETATQNITVRDSRSNRYFSFASMVIPSNDAFIANLNARAYEMFDRAGNFRGPISIDVYGRDVWDAGAEVNDPQGGAAFSTEGGASTSEALPIARHAGLDDFVGTGLPTGDDLQSVFVGQTPLARITIRLAGQPTRPIDRTAPEAVLESNELNAPAAFHEFNVTYFDPSGIDVSRIGTNDLFVIGRNGQLLRILSATTDAAPGTNPRTVQVTYRVAPRRGDFTTSLNSRYTVLLRNRTIGDAVGNRNFFTNLGEFRVRI